MSPSSDFFFDSFFTVNPPSRFPGLVYAFPPTPCKVLGFQRATEEDLQDVPDSYESYRRCSNIVLAGLDVLAQYTWIGLTLLSHNVADLGTVRLSELQK